MAVGLGSTGVSPGRVVSGKELLWLLNSNDMKRNEGKIVVWTSDLLVLLQEVSLFPCLGFCVLEFNHMEKSAITYSLMSLGSLSW